MSKVCSKCGRGPHIKITRSHSHIANRKRQSINLQTRHEDGKRALVCVRCIKTASKVAK
ncbi:MAG: 50S ribosomal protein L28 [Parcubacteria group bacterium]